MAQLLARSLQSLGYAVDLAGRLAAAEEAIALAEYGLVLLDRRLPDGDGMSLVRAMRAGGNATPVIILSALDQVPERVIGLDAGADDYLIKPFDTDELHARIRAAIRRPAGEAPLLRCGRLSFDIVHRQACIDGVPVLLKRRELAILGALCMRAGRVVQRERLFDQVYGFDEDVNSNTLDAHISRLRNRLASLDAGVVIHPVRGVGYMLAATE